MRVSGTTGRPPDLSLLQRKEQTQSNLKTKKLFKYFKQDMCPKHFLLYYVFQN